jgi:methylthioribose-1-phosphate isomerase
MLLEAIRFNNRQLEILDQLKLPFETVYLQIQNVKDGWEAIFDMKVAK